MKLTDDKKSALFRVLATKSLTEVGLEYDFDKHYKTMKSIKTAVYRVYNQVRATPSIYGVSDDTVELVVKAVSGRSVAPKPTIRETTELETTDIKTMIVKGRNIAMGLINKKLDHLSRHPKALRDTSITQLGTLFGIIFDKGQIISGQATEHVAVMSKIDKNLKPVEAIDMVLKMREAEQAK